MLPEAFVGSEWWRYIWVPLLTGMLVALATIFGKKSDSRTALDARLDTRMERLIASQATQIEVLTKANDEKRERLRIAQDRAEQWERFGRFIHEAARRLRHDLNNCRAACKEEALARGVSLFEEPELPKLPTTE